MKNSWKENARNINYKEENIITCELLDINNNWIYNELKIDLNYEYINNDGYLFKVNNELKHIEIPKNIFQTHKSFNYVKKNKNLRYSYISWYRNYPKYNYQFYNDQECYDFIKNNFDENVLKAYEKCPLNVMKADLWRYCIIFKYGGIYGDMDAVLLTNPDNFMKKSYLILTPEDNGIFFCNWTFAAPKESPILYTIINESVKRILEIKEIKGEHIVHELTGPALMTFAIEKYLKENNYITFSNKLDYYRYQNDVIHCFPSNIFHNEMIRHLFMGSSIDGWKRQRDKLLI